jgi:hypothetical protein
MKESKEAAHWTRTFTGNMEPRVWLMTAEKNLLLSWAMIQKIEAAEDFLSIRFLCEYGEVTLSSQESLRDLFELMRVERVASIDGRALNCRIREV